MESDKPRITPEQAAERVRRMAAKQTKPPPPGEPTGDKAKPPPDDWTQAEADKAAQEGQPQGDAAGTAGFVPLSPEWAAATMEKFKHRRFDMDKPPPPAEPILTLGGTPVLTVGNLAALCGQTGTGKTHAAIAALSANMARDPAADCLGWGGGNPRAQGLIYMDFEMSAQDHYAIIRESLRRAGLQRPPDWFYPFHMTGRDPDEGEALLGALLVTCRETHGGTRLALLDGAADLLEKGPNDETESLALVRRLHGLAIDFATGILGIIHLNPGSDFKTRGHFGSHLDRKAESVIQLSKETESAIVEMFASKARHKPIPKGTGPRFAWDEDWAGFRSAQTKQAERKAATLCKQAQLARDLFAVEQAFTHGDACRRIEELAAVKPDAAKKRLAALKDKELVYVERGTGLYRLSPTAAAAPDDDSATGEEGR